jgi:NAD-dependent deacetylase sirtuin 4
MVRISIPGLPPAPKNLTPSALTLLPPRQAAAHLSQFLAEGKGKTVLITGAGVSVDSGIRAYRGAEGSYSNPNYK